jgi:predicted RNA-binding Zn ribbon-like protein
MTMLYPGRMDQPDQAPPALDDDTPADLRGLINFVNSRASARRPERFDTPDHAAVFLAHCELGYTGDVPSTRDTGRLRRLRDAIMRTLEEPADPEAWQAFNKIAATAPVRLHLAVGPSASLEATRANSTDSLIAAVLDQCASAIASGRWDRLGACARCRRVFYDSTRSHTRRWCSYATCGNRSNVAAYRTRDR